MAKSLECNPAVASDGTGDGGGGGGGGEIE